MKKALYICYSVLCVLGCLLGAGFISGAEVVTFFVKFGVYGLLGIFISSIIFAVAIFKMSKSAVVENNQKYNFLPYCQVFISGAMFAGLVQIMSQLLNLSTTLCIVIFGIILFLAMVFGIKFANIFNIIVSISIIIIMPLVVQNIGVSNLKFDANITYLPGVFLAVLYATINIVACAPVIKNLPSKNTKIISIICGIISCVLLVVIYLILNAKNNLSSMPIIDLLSNKILSICYTIIFVVAMLSTLFSTSIGAKQIFNKMQGRVIESFCATSLIIMISFVGFGKIINYMYPLIGLAFFIQITLNKMQKQQQKTQKYAK